LSGFPYSQLLKHVYLKIDNGVSIIKNSILNISTIAKKTNDFIYIEQIGISVQIPKSINTTIAEILNQCSVHGISIMIRLKIHNSGLIVQINQIATAPVTAPATSSVTAKPLESKCYSTQT
jgi:hypothetical protein